MPSHSSSRIAISVVVLVIIAVVYAVTLTQGPSTASLLAPSADINTAAGATATVWWCRKGIDGTCIAYTGNDTARCYSRVQLINFPDQGSCNQSQNPYYAWCYSNPVGCMEYKLDSKPLPKYCNTPGRTSYADKQACELTNGTGTPVTPPPTNPGTMMQTSPAGTF